MELLSVQQLSFKYAQSNDYIFEDVSFTLHDGDFVVLAGYSGSGKSTLLRLLKNEVAPTGELEGEIFYKNTLMNELDKKFLVKEIGFVFQDPNNQIVMENVLDELSFGLENLNTATNVIRKKIAEITHFFDIHHLLVQKTSQLSGGEKQLLNLASVLSFNPNLILLDEPLAQLDPIAAKEFIRLLQQINEELGITILIVEHRLDELLTIADKLLVLHEAELLFNDKPRDVIANMLQEDVLMEFIPTSAKLYFSFEQQFQTDIVPLQVKEARQWLKTVHVAKKNNQILKDQVERINLFELKQIDFQYSKDSRPILSDLFLTVKKGEWFTIVGANGTGKSTLLKLIAGILQQQHGYFLWKHKKKKRLSSSMLGYLPQNPKLFFLQDSLRAEFDAISKNHGIHQNKLKELIVRFKLTQLLDRHPFDLSGGELQRAAIVGLLLTEPSVLLLDEPTKGLDPFTKKELGQVLRNIQREGVTIVNVTHDIEFAAQFSNRCGLLFHGEVIVEEEVGQFFKNNTYYTTIMNLITRDSGVPEVITLEEAKKSWEIEQNSLHYSF